MVSKQTSSYDLYNNQTDVYEYDYGSGAAGALVRRSHTDYLTTNPLNGLDYTGLSVHLRSLPTQTSVYDASGVERARSTYEYDNYNTDANHAALMDRPGISGFDLSFTTAYTTRGNVTATTHYLLVNGSVAGSISGYAQYDIAGNVVKAIDARGSATTFDFSDRFGSPDGEARANNAPVELSSQGQSSYAFTTLVTKAGQTAYTQFDYYLGRPVDGEDANGIVSSGYYNDALDRPTQLIRASNRSTSIQSQSLFSYDDANRVVTTTSDLSTFGDGLLVSKGLYDGLGRTTESRQYEGGTNYIAAQTQYDALGRAYKTSNPFRPWQSETALWTTSAFDALGRVTSVTTPDSAVVTSSYSGNTVTATDQVGKARKSVSDALGRLTSVYEDPSGLNYQTTYSYDVLGDLLTVNQGVQTRRFAYDSFKRLTSATNPESGTLSYTYDNNGNLLTRTDARSITTTYAYDALNRNQTITYSDGTPTISHFYDGATSGKGRLWYEQTNGASNALLNYKEISSYDAMGRPLALRQVFAANGVNYNFYSQQTYNLAGAVTSETYPSGHTVNYNYDQERDETAYLMRSTANCEHLLQAVADIENARNIITPEQEQFQCD